MVKYTQFRYCFFRETPYYEVYELNYFYNQSLFTTKFEFEWFLITPRKILHKFWFDWWSVVKLEK